MHMGSTKNTMTSTENTMLIPILGKWTLHLFELRCDRSKISVILLQPLKHADASEL